MSDAITITCTKCSNSFIVCSTRGQVSTNRISMQEEDWPTRFLVEFAVAYVLGKDEKSPGK